jgi:hypothetical protein
MTRPLIQIDDEIREMNDAELAQYNADVAEVIEVNRIKNDDIVKKSALLERLGITEEEAKLLLS